MDEAVVEVVARAMWKTSHDGEWPHDAEPAVVEIYRTDARAAIAAHIQTLEAKGFVIVRRSWLTMASDAPALAEARATKEPVKHPEPE